MAIIEVNNLSKKFKIYHDTSKTLKEKVLFPSREKYSEFWALKNINIKIERGKTVALIGENGSGKSTLLKILSKIIYPETGTVKIKGKVSSLLELGAGFHPDFTGIENIYTNASIFGLTNKETKDKLNDIIKFSELGEFIDAPVRTYSSGMYMRLAFSIAINVEPDILLIDEILAVGDSSFQKKCFDKLFELKKKDVTIVFVSHDISAVQKLCDSAIWLKDGQIVEQGDVNIVIAKYLQYMSEKDEKRLKKENNYKEINKSESDNDNLLGRINAEKRWGNRKMELYDLEIVDKNNKNVHMIQTGDKITIKFKYKVNSKVDNAVFGLAIRRIDNLYCYGTNTEIDKIDSSNIKEKGIIEFQIDKVDLLENTYFLDIAVQSETGEVYDYHYGAYKFGVINIKKEQGVCKINHKWIIN